MVQGRESEEEMTAEEELKLVNLTLEFVERRYNARINSAPYCEQGINAYAHAETAVYGAISDVRRAARETAARRRG